jgi:Mce-associated membrane protein
VIPALVVALVVALVALALVWREWDHASERSDDVAHAIDVVADPADEAEAAARDAAVRMSTYDYQTLDKDFAWIDRIGTDQFREDFSVLSKSVKKVVRVTRTQAQGEVMASAVQLDDETHATAIVLVDQLIADRSTPPLKRAQLRLGIKLVRQGDRWLVDEIETFSK